MRGSLRGLLIPLALAASLSCAPAAAPAPSAPRDATPAASSSAPATSPSAPQPASGAAPTPTPEPATVRYGIAANSLNFLVAKIAVEQGIYRQYGLNVEINQVGAGVQVAAQMAGELEYTTGYPPAVRTAAQGGGVRIVSTSVGAPLFVMMSRPEITSLADLRGKLVGITTRGGAIDKTTRDLLELAGLTDGVDVTILATGAQTPLLVDSLNTGRVQAAALSAPWFIRARTQGMRVLANAAELVREPQNGLVVTDERLARQRAQVVNMVKAEIAAIRSMRERRAEAAAVAREWLAISQEEADEGIDYLLPVLVPDSRIDVAGLERSLVVDKREGNIPADFRVEQVVDVTVADEAARAMGINP